MNRRQFVKRSGLMVAAAVVGDSVWGCATIHDGLVIPCLGPAAAPTPVPGMSYIRASEIGCALDCDLEWGFNKQTQGKATDDGPRINAAMAGASADHPITLIIDGSALISGLFLPAGGYWAIAGLGCGTGFFVMNGTNNDGIHNGGPNAAVPSEPGPPVPPRGRNVALSNFTLNGNGRQGGDSTTGLRQGSQAREVWYFGINLMDLDYITVENVVVVNSPAYHFRFSNVGHVSITGCVTNSTELSTDGLHFDGPSNDIAISNCDLTCGDDAIALNCPEGHMGDISRVSVDNCKFYSWSMMRLDSIQCSGCLPKYNIDSVSVTNCTGSVRQAGFLIGQGAQANPGSVTGLKISNCNFTAPAVLELGANFGSIELDSVTLTASAERTNPSFTSPGMGFARTSPYFKGCTFIGSSLTLNNCVLQRVSDGVTAAVILEYGSSISNFVINGFSIQDPVGKSYGTVASLVAAESGTVGQLVLNAVDPKLIRVPCAADQFSDIALVSGAGVLATGWEFPDAVMANEVPYLSSSTHLPSIKIDGVVEPYP
jgi:Glycosyl hydrolases family 28